MSNVRESERNKQESEKEKRKVRSEKDKKVRVLEVNEEEKPI